MTPYTVRPPDSPVFVACRKRRLKTVRKLLDGKLASPFDLTPGGATPLYVSLEVLLVVEDDSQTNFSQLAAVAPAPEICKLLIERGADGNFTGVPGGP